MYFTVHIATSNQRGREELQSYSWVFFFFFWDAIMGRMGVVFFGSIIKKEKWVDKPHTKKLVGFDPLMPTISHFFFPYNFYRLKYIHSHIRRGYMCEILDI